VAAVALAALLAGCGERGGTALLDASDLPALVSAAPTTPAGVPFRTLVTGRVSLDDVVAGTRRGERSRRLRALRFVRAFEATYRSNATDHTDRDALGAAATAVLFADEDGATRALAVLAESGPELVAAGIDRVEARGLGGGAWGFRASFLAGDEVFYGFRERNVVLLVGMGGDASVFDEADAHAYADTVEAQARLL
jgi:hypothetical protein